METRFLGYRGGARASLAGVRAPASGPLLGPELWPQPAFDSAAGLTLSDCSVTGGHLVIVDGGADGVASATARPAFEVGETYLLSAELSQTDPNGEIILGLGDAVVTFSQSGVTTATRTVTNTTYGLRIFFTTEVSVSIDNVSVRKVLG